MTRTEEEATAPALRQVISRLDPNARTLLARAVLPETQLTGEDLVATLARTMADPAWPRGAVRMLDPIARTGLRILARLDQGASAQELDQLTQFICGWNGESAPASEQLLAAGAVWPLMERSFLRQVDMRLRVLPPLRRKWAALSAEPSTAELPPDPSPAEEDYAALRPSFELGVVLAALMEANPRATRLGDMHRGDEKALAERLAAVCGGEEAAIRRMRELGRRGLLVAQDGRLQVDLDAVDRWTDVTAALLSERLSERRHTALFLSLFGRLAADEGWVPRSALAETAAVAVLSRQVVVEATPKIMAEIAELRRLPGVLTRTVDGTEYFRLSHEARRAIDGVEPEPRAQGRSLLVQPNLQIVAQLGTPLQLLVRLGRCCRLSSADQVAVFALDEQAARRGAAEGVGGSELLGMLEQHASHGVPATVARAIADWTRAKASARVVVGAVVLLDLPPEEVRRIVGRSVEVEVIAPGVYRVDSDEAAQVLKTLRSEGITCQEFGRRRGRDPGSWRDDREHAPLDTLRALVEEASRELARTRALPS